MMTNNQLLAIAKKQIGNTGGKYRSYAGYGGSWCNMFVYWLFNANGCGSLFPMKTAQQKTYCPTSIQWCKKNLAQIPLYLALPCDIIYFDWDRNGNPNHIGIVESRKSTSAINTIEGNTSGGKVDDKTREGKYVQAVYRPHFKGSYKLGTLVIDGQCGYSTIANLQKALKINIDGVLGIATVKALQKRAGTTADGQWGKGTSKAVQKMCGLTGKAIDGDFGAQSVKALQAWCNKQNKATTAPTTTTPTTSKPATSKPATPTRQKMKAIGHARKDYDHKAGDSSGKEVLRSKFTYSASSGSVYNWTYVFRPKDIAKANKTATMCEKAIANNAIGYNSHGETAYGKAKAMTKLAKAVNYDLSKIKTKCGCSCGDLICLCNHYAGLSTCYIGSGKQLAEALKKNSNFTTYKYHKGMQLYRGDVLITAHSSGKNNHVVMCL